jgi:membrane-associated phospholipid phosphatase
MDLGWQRSSILKNRKYRWVKVMLRLLDISICLATMFLKQHSIIDVVCGLALALILNAIMSRFFAKQSDPEAVQA